MITFPQSNDMMNISRRELRSINVYNPIIYGASFICCYNTRANIIRLRVLWICEHTRLLGHKKITVLSLLSRSFNVYLVFCLYVHVSVL